MFFTERMKRTMRVTRYTLGAAVLTSAVLIGSAYAQLPAAQYYGSVEYITGGFGIDESTAMKNAMSDYPLAMTFAAKNGGRSAYVSQVQVVIRDQYDATVLNIESQGPYLLVRLAPGTYQVHATYQNRTQSRPLTLADTGSSRMIFEWMREDTKPDDRPVRPADNSQPQDSQPEFIPGRIPGLD